MMRSIFHKQLLFRTIIAVGLLLIGFYIAYFFVVLLPQKEKIKLEQEKIKQSLQQIQIDELQNQVENQQNQIQDQQDQIDNQQGRIDNQQQQLDNQNSYNWCIIRNTNSNGYIKPSDEDFCRRTNL